MGLDIRMPIGLMFSTFGLILVAYGAVSDRAIYARSLGLNVNAIWGAVLLVFGLIMLFFGMHGNSKARSSATVNSEAPKAAGAIAIDVKQGS